MPAFGKNGIVDLNDKQIKETYQLVKSDGTVIMSCNNKTQLESHKDNLSQKLNCELQIKKVALQCL